MVDKSIAIHVGICVDVPVVVANVTILTDFIILGRPFLNIVGAVIDCNKGNVTFHVNGNEHTIHFPRKQPQVHISILLEKFHRLLLGVSNMIFLLLCIYISPLR